MTAGTLDIIKSEIGRLMGLDGHTDSQETNGQYAPFLTGDGLRGLKLYPMNKAFAPGNSLKVTHPAIYTTVFDDFLGKALDTFKWNALTGSDGSNAPVYSIATNGVVRLTTGGGSTHTMAVNGSQISGALNFLVSNDETLFEASVGKISSLTNMSLCVGMTDTSALETPFTRATTTTTAVADNAVAFLQDYASTTKTMYAVSVNAAGTPQSTSLGVNMSTTAFTKYRIDIDAAGNATFFIDGVQVAKHLLAVATTAVLTPTVAMFNEATGSPATLDVDYLGAQQLAGRG